MANSDDKNIQDLKARLGLAKKPGSDVPAKTSSESGGTAGNNEVVSSAANTPDESTGDKTVVAHAVSGTATAAQSPRVATGSDGQLATGPSTGAEKVSRSTPLEGGAVDLDVPLSGKSRNPALFVVVGILAIVFFGFGYFLGKTFESRYFENVKIAEGQRVKDYLEHSTIPGSNDKSLEVLVGFKDAIEKIAQKIEAAQANKDLESIEGDILAFLESAAAYSVQMDISGLMSDGMYNSELVGSLFSFSNNAQRLKAIAGLVAHEADLLRAMKFDDSATPPAERKGFLLKQEEANGVMWSVAAPLQAMQDPEAVQDAATGAVTGHQIAVLEQSQETGVRVATTEIVFVDIAPYVNGPVGELKKLVRKAALSRAASRIMELRDVAKATDPRAVTEKATAYANKAPYFTF